MVQAGNAVDEKTDLVHKFHFVAVLVGDYSICRSWHTSLPKLVKHHLTAWRRWSYSCWRIWVSFTSLSELVGSTKSLAIVLLVTTTLLAYSHPKALAATTASCDHINSNFPQPAGPNILLSSLQDPRNVPSCDLLSFLHNSQSIFCQMDV